MSDPHTELAELLRETRRLLSLPDNEFLWSPWVTAAEAVGEIDTLVAALKAGDAAVMERLAVLFAPTGALQEVSVSSGWADEYLRLADRFDRIAGDRP